MIPFWRLEDQGEVGVGWVDREVDGAIQSLLRDGI